MYHPSEGGVLNLPTMLVRGLISPKCVIVTLRFHIVWHCYASWAVGYLCHQHVANYHVTVALLPLHCVLP